MSKGIVRIKPRPTSGTKGQIILSSTDPNQWKLTNGSPLGFDDPSFEIKVGDIVECALTSQTECNLIRVVGTATMAKGKITTAPSGGQPGWLKVTSPGDPNPCSVDVGTDLHFSDPQLGALSANNLVECLPISGWSCDVTSVLQPA